MARVRLAAYAALMVLLLLGAAAWPPPTRSVPMGAAAAVGWPPSGGLVVAEVVTGGVSASDEYVELANTGPLALDLAGLEVAYVTSSGATVTRKAAWTASLLVEPGRHVLLANSLGSFASGADATYSGGLAASGGAVVLRPVGGTPVDAVGWGDAMNAFVEGVAAPAPAAGRSIERSAADTNDNAVDFVVNAAPIAQGLAWEPEPTPRPDADPDGRAHADPDARAHADPDGRAHADPDARRPRRPRRPSPRRPRRPSPRRPRRPSPRRPRRAEPTPTPTRPSPTPTPTRRARRPTPTAEPTPTPTPSPRRPRRPSPRRRPLRAVGGARDAHRRRSRGHRRDPRHDRGNPHDGTRRARIGSRRVRPGRDRRDRRLPRRAARPLPAGTTVRLRRHDRLAVRPADPPRGRRGRCDHRRGRASRAVSGGHWCGR